MHLYVAKICDNLKVLKRYEHVLNILIQFSFPDYPLLCNQQLGLTKKKLTFTKIWDKESARAIL